MMEFREGAWVAFGFFGQLMFTGRFLLQWIASERQGRSIVPRHFWTLSLLGSAVLLAYSIYRKDPVFILAQAFGSFIYVRNIMLLKREKS